MASACCPLRNSLFIYERFRDEHVISQIKVASTFYKRAMGMGPYGPAANRDVKCYFSEQILSKVCKIF